MNGTSEHFEPTEDAKTSQCRVVLMALREGPMSTLDLRALNVMSPAARVMDLRRRGLIIDTMRMGRCAVYALHGRAVCEAR